MVKEFGLNAIMNVIEPVEGKYRPAREFLPPKFSQFGNTTGLLLHLTGSIHHSVRVVIMESNFCVLLALAKLQLSGSVLLLD
jgi:hypothetical protein